MFTLFISFDLLPTINYLINTKALIIKEKENYSYFKSFY
jgi:hypothetical protein